MISRLIVAELCTCQSCNCIYKLRCMLGTSIHRALFSRCSSGTSTESGYISIKLIDVALYASRNTTFCWPQAFIEIVSMFAWHILLQFLWHLHFDWCTISYCLSVTHYVSNCLCLFTSFGHEITEKKINLCFVCVGVLQGCYLVVS